MENLLALSNGNLVARSSIKGVIKFKNKGVALRNEFNKILDFIAEPDSARQEIIVETMREILAAGRDWKQPDWDTRLAKAAKPSESKSKAPSAPPAA